MDPVITASLISAGSQFAGKGLGAVGAGLMGNPELDFAKEKEEARKKEWLKEMQLKRNTDTRAMNMKGIETLSALRGNAEEKYKRMIARDRVLASLNGGA